MTSLILTWLFFKLPLLLFILYVIGIQYQRVSLPKPIRNFCYFIAALALIIDVPLNWIIFSIYFWQFPRWQVGAVKPEWTFSDRINRMCLEDSTLGLVALLIGKLLNFFDPLHNHIPNAVTK